MQTILENRFHAMPPGSESLFDGPVLRAKRGDIRPVATAATCLRRRYQPIHSLHPYGSVPECPMSGGADVYRFFSSDSTTLQ